MPNFLAALMAIVSTFAQNGKPANLPPSTFVEVSTRGSAVSDFAHNLNPKKNINGSPDSNSQFTFGSNVSRQTPDAPKTDGRAFGLQISKQAKLQGETHVSSQNETENETEGEHEQSSDTTEVSVDTDRAGIPIPSWIPRSTDHSSGLDISTGGNLTASGKTDGDEDANTDTNVSFGQATSLSARGNSRR